MSISSDPDPDPEKNYADFFERIHIQNTELDSGHWTIPVYHFEKKKNAVAASNVVILFPQNNFFLHNLRRLPHVFFMRAACLNINDLDDGKSFYGLSHHLGLF
jgi:hypothetical protein